MRIAELLKIHESTLATVSVSERFNDLASSIQSRFKCSASDAKDIASAIVNNEDLDDDLEMVVAKNVHVNAGRSDSEGLMNALHTEFQDEIDEYDSAVKASKK